MAITYGKIRLDPFTDYHSVQVLPSILLFYQLNEQLLGVLDEHHQHVKQ